MNILFLDIHGVLSLPQFNDVSDAEAFDASAVEQFNRILRCSKFNTVVTSGLRRYRNINQLIEHFHKYGCEDPRIIAYTPVLNTPAAYYEVKEWLAHNPIDHFGVLDDDSRMQEFGDKFFKTEYITGLTKEIADAVIKHFDI